MGRATKTLSSAPPARSRHWTGTATLTWERWRSAATALRRRTPWTRPRLAIEHLPNFYEECKIWIESPTAPLEDVMSCFIEVVKFFDTDGEVRQGVKDFLEL